ncbi:MAG: hypothetical protein H0W25_07870, partial [Acidimicrobiia bacterium]|nr:hypothetical protein [Acidimicrobiia bacterium]
MDRHGPARLLIVAGTVLAAGVLALPFAGGLGTSSVLVSVAGGAPLSTTTASTATTAPPQPPVPAPTTVATPPPAPPTTSPAPVEAPPLAVPAD